MNFNGEYIRDCLCHSEFNMPMHLCNETFDKYWVECDSCGNKTKEFNSEKDAAFYWNEFQYKRNKKTNLKEAGGEIIEQRKIKEAV